MYYMVIAMASTQLNVRTSATLIEELDSLVDHGLFRNRTEAVNEGIRLVIRRYKAMKIAEKTDQISKRKQSRKSLTDALVELRDEEDA
jgi:Arc/MetJ-type ribon-helix-helix transcriptional regulator